MELFFKGKFFSFYDYCSFRQFNFVLGYYQCFIVGCYGKFDFFEFFCFIDYDKGFFFQFQKFFECFRFDEDQDVISYNVVCINGYFMVYRFYLN